MRNLICIFLASMFLVISCQTEQVKEEAEVMGLETRQMDLTADPKNDFYRRPAYSGYFNALYAPVWLLPLAAAAIAEATSFAVVFWLALAAAGLQLIVLWRLKRHDRLGEMVE